PGIAARPDERMLFQPETGVCLAGRTVAALQRLARRDGASVRAPAPVLGIEPRGDEVLLSTPAGEVTAPVAVITAGPCTRGLLAGPLPRDPRLAVTVQQVRYFAPRPGAGSWPTLIEWPPEGLCWYAVPAVGGAPGVKVAAHVLGRAVDPRDGPFTELDPGLEAEASAYVRGRLPGLDPAGLGAETCLSRMRAGGFSLLAGAGPGVVGGVCPGRGFRLGPLLGVSPAARARGRDTRVPRGRFPRGRRALAAPRWVWRHRRYRPRWRAASR